MSLEIKVSGPTGPFFKTRDGRKVRIYAVDSGDMTIHGAVLRENRWELSTWYVNGSHLDEGEGNDDFDLVSLWEEPEKKVQVQREIMGKARVFFVEDRYFEKVINGIPCVAHIAYTEKIHESFFEVREVLPNDDSIPQKKKSFPEKQFVEAAIKLIGEKRKFDQSGEPLEPDDGIGWGYSPSRMKDCRKGAMWAWGERGRIAPEDDDSIRVTREMLEEAWEESMEGRAFGIVDEEDLWQELRRLAGGGK